MAMLLFVVYEDINYTENTGTGVCFYFIWFEALVMHSSKYYGLSEYWKSQIGISYATICL